MQNFRIFHLGGPGRFDYLIKSSARGSDDWLIYVRGERSHQLTEITGEELVEYANCRREIEAVKRFFNRYGPPEFLHQNKDGLLYAITLGRWGALQLRFCKIWDRMLGDVAQRPIYDVRGEGEFRLVDGELAFLADTHYMGLQIKLSAVSATGKLRKCLNPNCVVSPYFIADHGKTQYCSEECGKWGQRKAKLKYWHEKKHDTGRKT